jgi:hypothetical protein
VLRARWQANPRVHAFFVDRDRGGREARIRKRAHGYSDVLFIVAFD